MHKVWISPKELREGSFLAVNVERTQNLHSSKYSKQVMASNSFIWMLKSIGDKTVSCRTQQHKCQQQAERQKALAYRTSFPPIISLLPFCRQLAMERKRDYDVPTVGSMRRWSVPDATNSWKSGDQSCIKPGDQGNSRSSWEERRGVQGFYKLRILVSHFDPFT
ncbi:Hypothetical predicted protein [Podarcis lilfordi]|uniref:Uncharacterized protein n=1 Tax=Podarcis lilfordi TaxID=74358 RepID=A0AA35KH72_9SAUR|nr:Hypothetical predicted protein [Podarcis lilfordi]